MSATTRPAILLSLACVALAGPAALAALRPTHSPLRDTRRLSLPAQHARAGHHAPIHGPARGHSTTAAHAPHASAGAGAHRRAAAARHHGTHSADTRTYAEVHAWEQAQHEDASPAEPLDPAPATATADSASGSSLAVRAGDLTATSPELPRLPTVSEEAATPVILPPLRDKRGRLIVPAPLYGSHDILVHQNTMADHDGLARVRDDDDLLDLRRQRKLVPLPTGETLRVDDRLPADRRFSRPWTAAFLAVVSRDFYASFHEPLQVNSAVRTVDVQERLLRTNRNAAAVAGDTASPHLTGQAVDIGKRGLTMPEIAWMRAYLGPLIEEGKIDVEEEFQQSCFHISVYRAYQQPRRVTMASTSQRGTPAGAVGSE